MKIPSWDSYFMKMATLASKRSTCLRRNVGAILVKDKRVLATGYNGAPSGITHCIDRGCLREKLNIPSGERHELCYALHAEQNCIIQAACYGIPIQGSTLYCTLFPCLICSKMLINIKIEKIFYLEGYPDSLSKDMLIEAKIPLFQLGEDTKC